MIRPHGSSDDLERFIDKTLRDLGQRQAPPTLESRVLAELTRRAALPWWRQHFAHWPLVARAAFLIASLGSIKLAVVTAMWLFGGVNGFGQLTHLMAWMRSVAHLASSMIGLSVSLIGLIPPGLLYSVLALCVLAYGTLLALGAAGYHILYADPTSRGLSQR